MENTSIGLQDLLGARSHPPHTLAHCGSQALVQQLLGLLLLVGSEAAPASGL